MITGIIYAIIDDGYFYIGSTTKSVLERLGFHIIDSKKKSSKYSKLYKYINEIRGGWENIIYIILEEVQCENIHELKRKEYDYIKPHTSDEFCLNKVTTINSEYIMIRKKYKK